MSDGPTGFAETNALAAFLDDDENQAREALANMTSGELHRLADAADQLSALTRRLAREARR